MVRQIFTIPFELKVLWVLLALLSSLHFHASLWLKRDRFSLTNNAILFWKHSFALSIFFRSCFLSRIRSQNFLFTKFTIVPFGLPLPILRHSLISLFSPAPCPQDGYLTLLQEFPKFLCYSSWCIGPVYFLKYLVQ